MNEVTLHQSQNQVAARHELTVADLQHRQHLIQQVMREVMIAGHHYGVVPGTDGKQSLLKPGAEKLCATFMLAPSFSVKERDLANGHREYRADCTLTHITTGVVAGMATGSCSTMESKYRWRLASRKCPECGSDAIRKSKKGGGFFCWGKLGGCGVEFADGDQRIISQALGRTENPDIADAYNTVLKMATKRALVAAALVVTGASDMFVTEEDDEEEEQPRATKKPVPKQEPAKLSPKQDLARDCARMVTLLDWSADEVRAALAENGIAEKFERWSQLDESALDRARKMFEAALRSGSPVEGRA